METNKEKLVEILKNMKVKFTHKNDGRWLALATLQIEGVLEISGWRISESDKNEGGLWIQPPTLRTEKGRYIQFLWFQDDQLKEEVYGIIEKQYNDDVARFIGDNLEF